MDVDSYCREIEAYLCRKNDGHLIRIVGPSFERVCGWAEQGIPLKVVYRGIDRHFERYYARGPRRRPVRIDFCEADVLDTFDEWRRAVGVLRQPRSGELPEAEATGAEDEPVGGPSDDRRQASPSRSRVSLTAHLDRVILRLTSLRAGGQAPLVLDRAIEQAVRELDAMRSEARTVRGEARRRLLQRLQQIDSDLLGVARAALTGTALDEIAREAAEELEPFRARMVAAAYQQALAACTTRLVRDRMGLPDVIYDVPPAVAEI